MLPDVLSGRLNPSKLPSPVQAGYALPTTTLMVSTTCVSAGMIAMGAVWATGPVAACRSSRAGTCRMDCRTRSLCACRTVWRAAAMLPRQPCSRSRGGRSGYPAALRPVGSRVRVDTVADHHYPRRGVWRTAVMLPRQPCSRSGAWHTVPHPGHGGLNVLVPIIESVRQACDPCA